MVYKSSKIYSCTNARSERLNLKTHPIDDLFDMAKVGHPAILRNVFADEAKTIIPPSSTFVKNLVNGRKENPDISDVIFKIKQKICESASRTGFGLPEKVVVASVELAAQPEFHVDDTRFTAIVGLYNADTPFDGSSEINSDSFCKLNTLRPLSCLDSDDFRASNVEVACVGDVLIMPGARSKLRPTPHSVPHKLKIGQRPSLAMALIFSWL